MSTPSKFDEYGQIINADSLPMTAPAPLPNLAVATTAKDPRPSNRRSQLMLRLGLALLSVILIALGFFFWTDGSNKTSTELAVSEVTTPTAVASSTTVADSPTATPVPPTANPTPDLLLNVYNDAVGLIRQDPNNLSYHDAAIQDMLKVVKSNPDYQGSAATYLFWLYIHKAELESQLDANLMDAPAVFTAAVKFGTDNKAVLEQEFNSPDNAKLATPTFEWIAKVSSFDQWLSRVQSEADQASNYATAVTANKQASQLNAAIQAWLKVYNVNPEYLHNAESGNDKWVAFVLYDAYSRQADVTTDKTAKCQALAAAKAIKDKNTDLSNDIFHIEYKLLQNGCNSQK